MKLFGLLFLINLPLIALAQANTSDTLTLKGIIFIGDHRRQIDSIELVQNNKTLISFSTDRSGKFEIKNLSENSYRLFIKELDYDTTFSLAHDRPKELWIFIPVGCEVNEEIANQEIKKGHPRLLLIGGIAPSHVVGQENFEKKFNVSYYDFGCTPPNKECVIAYNKFVFDYLDRTYGEKWRKSVRTDVIGYKR